MGLFSRKKKVDDEEIIQTEPPQEREVAVGEDCPNPLYDQLKNLKKECKCQDVTKNICFLKALGEHRIVCDDCFERYEDQFQKSKD